jgi:hypothetical protein
MKSFKSCVIFLIVILAPLVQSCEKPECDKNNEGDIDVYNYMNEDIALEFDDIVTDTLVAGAEKNFTRHQGFYKIRAVGITSGETIVYNIEVEECQTRSVTVLW